MASNAISFSLADQRDPLASRCTVCQAASRFVLRIGIHATNLCGECTDALRVGAHDALIGRVFQPVRVGVTPAGVEWVARTPGDVEPMRARLHEQWRRHVLAHLERGDCTARQLAVALPGRGRSLLAVMPDVQRTLNALVDEGVVVTVHTHHYRVAR